MLDPSSFRKTELSITNSNEINKRRIFGKTVLLMILLRIAE